MMKRISYLLMRVLMFSARNFPYIGYAYLAVMVIAAWPAMFAPVAPEWAAATISLGWKIYIVCALITLWVSATFVYLNCCGGGLTFWEHLVYCTYRHFQVFLAALAWPVMWRLIERDMTFSYGINWWRMTMCAFNYWKRRRELHF